jgi:DNA-binding MarR family transcriptional regulator
MSVDSEGHDPFELIEQAVMRIGWLAQRQFMQLLADERFDLTVPQFHTLMHLAHCSGECKMSDLARSTHQSAASLTGVVDRLLEKRLVARGRPEGDRRQVVVSATERGHQLLKEIKRAHRIDTEGALSQMRSVEISELLRLLDIMFDGMARMVQSRERGGGTQRG